MGVISDGLRTLCAWLCSAIYMLIAGLYDLFMNISRVELLTSDQIQPIYQRITMILTIVMVFYVTFETVKFVIQPEQFSDKEKGAQKIVIRMVMVVLLIAFVPQIFSGAYWVQNKIFDTQVFSKVILGKQSVNSDEFGKNLSYNIFSMFYSLDTESFSESELESKKCGSIPCKQVVLMNYNQLQTEGKLTLIYEGLNESGKTTDSTTGEKVEKYYINFNGLFAVVVGGFIAYMLLLYCVDAGVRVVQLLYLQIIAPIPIMGYLSPKKDGIFEKWTKQCVTTYLDLFIRVGIIYFVLMICQILGNAFKNGTLVNNVSGNGTWLVYVALIMGLLLFAHKMPKMLQELFPKMGAASGNFGLKATERVAPEAARIAGAALGGTRAVTGAIARGVNRYNRNKANGAKPLWTKDGQEQAKQRAENRKRARRLGSDYKRDTKDSERIRKNGVTDEQVAEKKKKVAAAKAEYDMIKDSKDPKDQQRKKIVEDNLNKEAKEYRELMQKRNGITDKLAESKQNFSKSKANLSSAQQNLNTANQELEAAKQSGDQNAINAAEAKVASAQSQMNTAQTDYDQKFASYDEQLKQNKDSVAVQRWQEIKESQKKMKEAKDILDAAQQSGDSNAIKKAQDNYNKTQEELNLQTESYQRILSTTKNQEMMTALKSKADDAYSQVAEDNNTKYGSVVGATLWGAVAGGVTGATTGAKATKLEDIVSKAKEGHKKDVKNVQELNKYYDNGGNVGFIGGTWDRTITKIEKDIGMDTPYARINLENQRLETNIKSLDSSISRADNTKKEFDATEDRIKSKLDDNKVKVNKYLEIEAAKAARKGDTNYQGPKTKSGTLIDFTGTDGNYGAVNRKYRAIAKNANAISEAASKEAEEKESKLNAFDTNKRQKFEGYMNGTFSGPMTADEQKEYDDYKIMKQESEAARINATKKAEEAVRADRDAKDVEKMMTRAIFTEMLNDPNYESKAGSLYDGVAVQKLKSEYNELRIALQDPVLRAKTLSRLQPADQTAFINSRYEDYDQMDAVMTAMSNARSELAMEKQAKQDQKNRNQASSRTEAQKAAQDYNGGSGK